jgi:CSLREA domain-containing protein
VSERQMRRVRNRQAVREASRRRRVGGKLAATAGAALGATVLFAPGAQADTFQVTSTDDEFSDPDPGDHECDADCTLREALYDANFESTDADTITFASNVTGTITIDTSNYGQFYILEEVTIQGPGANVLAVSGDDEVRVFYLDAERYGEPYDPVSISGLTVTTWSSPATRRPTPATAATTSAAAPSGSTAP